MSNLTTSTLSTDFIVYIQKRFLERAKNNIMFKEGASQQAIPANSGVSMTFNRYTPLANTPSGQVLTEATVPTAQAVTNSQVVATLVQYGGVLTVSDVLSSVSIDSQSVEKTDLLSTQMAETIDNKIRDELFSGFTVLYANGRANLNAITATDALTAKDVLRVRRNLFKNGTQAYDDGRYIGKVGADTTFDLMQDSTWVNAHTYKDGDNLYNAELGRLWNVRFLEANQNQKNEANATPVTCYSNFFHGKGAFATVDLDNMTSGLYVHQGGKQDTSNPLEQFITIGWKTIFAVKTLNANFGINLKTAANS
jgi:N4-gp56 family major capsid protein